MRVLASSAIVLGERSKLTKPHQAMLCRERVLDFAGGSRDRIGLVRTPCSQLICAFSQSADGKAAAGAGRAEKTPRTAAARCHNRVIFPSYFAESDTSEFSVLTSYLTAEDRHLLFATV